MIFDNFHLFCITSSSHLSAPTYPVSYPIRSADLFSCLFPSILKKWKDWRENKDLMVYLGWPKSGLNPTSHVKNYMLTFFTSIEQQQILLYPKVPSLVHLYFWSTLMINEVMRFCKVFHSADDTNFLQFSKSVNKFS